MKEVKVDKETLQKLIEHFVEKWLKGETDNKLRPYLNHCAAEWLERNKVSLKNQVEQSIQKELDMILKKEISIHLRTFLKYFFRNL